MSTLSSTFHIESPCTYYGSSIYAARQVSGAVSTFPCLTHSKYCPSNDVLRCFGPHFFRNETLSTPCALVFLFPIEEMRASCSNGRGWDCCEQGLCAESHCVPKPSCARASGVPKPAEHSSHPCIAHCCPPKHQEERKSLSRGGFSTVANAISAQVKFLLLSCITFNYPHHPKNIPQLPSGQNYAYF